MNASKHIEAYIQAEKQVKANPFLKTRIMESLKPVRNNKVPFWQSLVVATSLALAIAAGFAVGNMYNKQVQEYTALNINDSSIENLNIYYKLSNE